MLGGSRHPPLMGNVFPTIKLRLKRDTSHQSVRTCPFLLIFGNDRILPETTADLINLEIGVSFECIKWFWPRHCHTRPVIRMRVECFRDHRNRRRSGRRWLDDWICS